MPLSVQPESLRDVGSSRDPRVRIVRATIGKRVDLFALAALALYLSYLVAHPFLNAIFAAVVWVVIFHPLHAKVDISVRRPNLAAIISTVVVLLTVAIPAVVLGIVVTAELGDLYRSLSEKSATQGGVGAYFIHLLERPVGTLGRYVDLSRLDMRSTLLGWVNAASRYLVGLSGRAVSNLISLMLDTVVVFFTLFFLFRDGPRIHDGLAESMPLTHQQAKKLMARISETIVASAYGGIAVGFAQGSLTGVAFWVLGLSSPVLWALVASLASLLPLVGTAIVWLPGVVVLLASGHSIKALLLFRLGRSSGRTGGCPGKALCCERTREDAQTAHLLRTIGRRQSLRVHGDFRGTRRGVGDGRASGHDQGK